ncbi:MAG: hypothetical protein AAFO86_00815 [Pseudomonadota bacterium]
MTDTFSYVAQTIQLLLAVDAKSYCLLVLGSHHIALSICQFMELQDDAMVDANRHSHRMEATTHAMLGIAYITYSVT